MPKRELYASLPPTEGFTGSHNSTIRFRSALALATVKAFDPHVIVVPIMPPGGLFRELAPSLDWLRRRDPSPSLALLMRDITFGPEQTRSIWTNRRCLVPCSTKRMPVFLSMVIAASSIPSRPTGYQKLPLHARAFADTLHHRHHGVHQRRSVTRWEQAPCLSLPSRSAAAAMAARCYARGPVLKACEGVPARSAIHYVVTGTAASGTGPARDHGDDRHPTKRSARSTSTLTSSPR